MGDFDKPVQKTEEINSASVHAKGNNPDNNPLYDDLWNDETLLKMTGDLNEVLVNMVKEDPSMMQEYEKFQTTECTGVTCYKCKIRWVRVFNIK